jgi:hypothetical protein
LYLLQKMREEMDRAWKDFFEKNPCKKEADILRRVEERLRSKKIRRISTDEFAITDK